jgi:hypothetical protein
MTLLLLQIISCAVMTGVIWTIQILHYPTFLYVSENEFQKFHAFHSRNVSFIVMPLMIFEFATAVALVIYFNHESYFWINLVGVILIWLVTFFISVPLHNRLAKATETLIVNRLVYTNWPRTILWSARLVLLFYFLINFVQQGKYNEG